MTTIYVQFSGKDEKDIVTYFSNPHYLIHSKILERLMNQILDMRPSGVHSQLLWRSIGRFLPRHDDN